MHDDRDPIRKQTAELRAKRLAEEEAHMDEQRKERLEKEYGKPAAPYVPLTETQHLVLTVFLILLGFGAFAAITAFFGIVVALLVTIIVLIIGHIGRGF